MCEQGWRQCEYVMLHASVRLLGLSVSVQRLIITCDMCSYNKREEQFAARREYDDYLEEREDISTPARLAACTLSSAAS